MNGSDLRGDILVHRGDILASLKALYFARPDWIKPLRAVAVEMGVDDAFDAFVMAEQAAGEVSR